MPDAVPDPVDVSRSPVCRFGPDRRLIALSGVLSAVAVVAVAVSHDRPGRLLAGIAAVVLAGYFVSDLIFWPRLIASSDGLRIRTPAIRANLSWADIDEIRVDERSRLGLTSRTLEIDAGSVLVVFSRRSLGNDPRTVLGLLRAFDPRQS